MAEPSTIRQDNPLFIRYGALVERCFTSANGKVGAPLSLFPSVGKAAMKGEEGSPKSLADYADTDEVATAQGSVDTLRKALLKEAALKERGGNLSSSLLVTQQFQEFRYGLHRGKEAMLEENPFYELVGLFYRINLTALKNAFVDAQKNISNNPPRSITVSRSYRHIWSSARSVTSLRQKFAESFGKIGSVGKLLIGLILFLGSTMTTAKGVIDLVQLPGFVAMFGDALAGAEHESVRTFFALFVGLVFSSVILDFKSRLFQGVAEVGKVFPGFFYAFRRYPRWIFISLFLTMISIWTNYDGIVLLVSKTEDLSYQWKAIETQVNRAMGDPTQRDLENPGSLRDLHAILGQKAKEAVAKFKQVPEDERSGAASSGIAKIGPRYWAKYFIVHGGYIPNQNDISTAYRRSSFIHKIDGMLQHSNLDLRISLEEKIHRILLEYDNTFRRTEAAVQKGMHALSDQMTFEDYSFDELMAMFNLESYHVNAGVQQVVGHLEENKNAFARAALEINRLAESHIALLRAVDKVGTPANNNYTIAVRIAIPQLEAIDNLRQGEIPMAKRRNLVELKSIMLERYGVALGSSLLFLVLFIAVFMDLSDPILYSAMIARWGRRDRHFLDENVARFHVWEDAYVQNLRKFLVQSDILPLLPKLPAPKIQTFHYVYNQFLEDVEPRVKDISSRGLFERLRFWFFGLFLETRIDYVEGYNARQTATMKCLKDQKTYAPRLLNKIFPGLLDPFKIGVDHFDKLFERNYRGLRDNTASFEKVMQLYTPDGLNAAAGWCAARLPDVAVDGGREGEKKKSTGRTKPRLTGLLRLFSFIGRLLHFLFRKPLTKAEPAFPLTRISRIRALALSNYKSRGHINHLLDFVPSLRHFLRERLFLIKKEILLPLLGALEQIPNGDVIEESLGVYKLNQEYDKVERGLMELLGLSQFQGIQVSEQMVQTIVEASGVGELVGIYLNRDTDDSVLEKRIVTLESRLARAYKLIRDLVDGQDALIFTLTKIRRDYLSPINAALSKLHNRARIEASLGLRKIKEDIVVIESCLLELWDTSSSNLPMPAELVNNKQPHYTNMGAILDLIRRNSAVGQVFDMVDYVKQLEVGIALIRKRLDASIYQLTMVDKITDNVHALLKHSLEIVELIFVKDDELHLFPMPEQVVEQKKFDFLEDNRLFFRTVSLQVDSLRARISTLEIGDEVGINHSVELARGLEKQAIMLRYFLKNSLDYLEGKRDSVGLTAALADLQPRVDQPSQKATEKPPETFPETKQIPPSQEGDKGENVVPEDEGVTPKDVAQPVGKEGGSDFRFGYLKAKPGFLTSQLVEKIQKSMKFGGPSCSIASADDQGLMVQPGIIAESATMDQPEAVSQTETAVVAEAAVQSEVVVQPEVDPEPEAVPRRPVDLLADNIQGAVEKTKQILLDISLWEWDLLKKPIPPQNLLRVIHAYQPTLDKVSVEAEGVLRSLEMLRSRCGGDLGSSPSNLSTLQSLKKDSDRVLEQIHDLFDRVSLPIFVDRRAALSSFMDSSHEQRKRGERAKRSEDASRRENERIVVQSQVEVTVDKTKKLFATTRDISARGLCLETSILLDGLHPGMDISFRLLFDKQATSFPGRLFRISGSMLVVTLVSGYESQFIQLVRAEILRERGGEVGFLEPEPLALFADGVEEPNGHKSL